MASKLNEHMDYLMGGYHHLAHPNKTRNEPLKRTIASALIIGSILATDEELLMELVEHFINEKEGTNNERTN